MRKVKKLISFDNISARIEMILFEHNTNLNEIIDSDKNIEQITFAELFHKLNDADPTDKEHIFKKILSDLDQNVSLSVSLAAIYENILMDGENIYGPISNMLPVRNSLRGK